MLSILTSEAREFVLRVLEENVFENSRLNAINRMEYYSVECTVLLDGLAAGAIEPVDLGKAAKNFQPYEIKDLILKCVRCSKYVK